MKFSIKNKKFTTVFFTLIELLATVEAFWGNNKEEIVD